MRAKILVRLKKEVLDAPGNVLAERLVDLGFSEVKEARIGKLIELDLDAADRGAADERVKNMCEQLLANAIIEDYEVQSLE